MFQVDITDRAQADMRSNALWWKENQSYEQADQWLSGVALAIESLQEMPLRCPIAAEAKRLGIPIRCLFYGVSSRYTHRVLFTIVGEKVIVLRILSTNQNQISDAADLH